MHKIAKLATIASMILMQSFALASAQHALEHAEPSRQLATKTPSASVVPVTNGTDPAHVEWGYTGPTGPENWAEVSVDYSICSQGQQESPIDISNPVSADLGRLAIDWRSVPLRVLNNGHTIQVDTPAGSTMRVRERSYALLQMHIHHPSEHLLKGQRFPLELHFVHRAPDGIFGVIGVFVEEGRYNPELQKILGTMPTTSETTRTVAGSMLDLDVLRPKSSVFYRYEGSLTTPPCSETVDWVVMEETIQASAAQIDTFERVYPFNARPVQALNRRFLLRGR